MVCHQQRSVLSRTMPRTEHFSISSKVDVNIAVLKTGQLDFTAIFPKPECSLLATAVLELGQNIIKYAERGVLRLSPLEDERRYGVEIVAEDRGPGIRDLEAAMQDHVSTGGTLGLGLPGVRRMMDEFEIESELGQGTRVTARKWIRKQQ